MEASAEHELGFSEAHRNGSCNESKTDMLAGAATSKQCACMTKNLTKIVSQTPMDVYRMCIIILSTIIIERTGIAVNGWKIPFFFLFYEKIVNC